jgi:hypothetical protein
MGKQFGEIVQQEEGGKAQKCSERMQILLFMLRCMLFCGRNQRGHLKMSSNILYGLLRAATHGTNINKNMLFSNIEYSSEKHKTRTKEERKFMQSHKYHRFINIQT